MEDYQKARALALRHLKIADHMLTQTYPLLKEPKLLLAVAENLYKAVMRSIDAILLWERLYKRIPPYHNTSQNKINLFRARSERRYGFPDEYAELARRLHETMRQHRESPVEFSRKDKFVIADNEYKLKTLTPEELKRGVETAKELAEKMQKMVSRYERTHS